VRAPLTPTIIIDQPRVAVRPVELQKQGPQRQRVKVELLSRYSNQPDIAKPLVKLMQLVATEPAADAERSPLVLADDSRPPALPFAARLSEAEVQTMIKSYLDGRTRVELAADFAVSDCTIKRLLRQHGVRKYRNRQQ
jgi:hypothetical protein